MERASAVIARPTTAPDGTPSYEGVYVWEKGDPGTTGRRIHAQVADYFTDSAHAAAAYYIDVHTWGFIGIAETVDANYCICHDGRWNKQVPRPATCTPRDDHQEWTYVLRPEGLLIMWKHAATTLILPWSEAYIAWDAIVDNFALERRPPTQA